MRHVNKYNKSVTHKKTENCSIKNIPSTEYSRLNETSKSPFAGKEIITFDCTRNH